MNQIKPILDQMEGLLKDLKESLRQIGKKGEVGEELFKVESGIAGVYCRLERDEHARA